MPDQVEWAVNTEGRVMVAIAGPLDHAPEAIRVTPTGRVLIRDASGSETALTPPKGVLLAIRNVSEVLVAELQKDATLVRETTVQIGGRPAPQTKSL